jgi:hypothetical protein
MGVYGERQVVGLEEIGQGYAVKDKFPVGIISYEVYVLSLGTLAVEERDEVGDALLRIHGTRRVVRAVEEDSPRPGVMAAAILSTSSWKSSFDLTVLSLPP